MGEQKLPSEIIPLLEEACQESLKNFDLTVHEVGSARQGYMGEMVCE